MHSRRQFLGHVALACASGALLPSVRLLAGDAAGAGDARLVVVLLRGGLDGLHALVPYADPNYARLRGALSPEASAGSPMHRLDGTWALHASLSYSDQLYAAGQFLPIAAVAPPYWGRSHFDAQDCVENGTDRPHGAQEGWLNRCVGALAGKRAVVAAAVMPLMTRGTAHVDTWSPPLPTQIDPVLLQRLGVLYAKDKRLDPVFRSALAQAEGGTSDSKNEVLVRGDARLVQSLRAVGGFLSREDGARIAFVEDDGWDTHANEGPILSRKLGELDTGLRAVREALGNAWARSIVVVVSEFGRTAAVNGTLGTDHGSGGAAFLAGGAVKGGRVGGDFAGLASSALYEGRDVRATTDLRSVFKGVLAEHLKMAEHTLDAQVFPDSARVKSIEGLVAKKSA